MENYEIYPGDRTPSINLTWSKLELKSWEHLIFNTNNLKYPNPEKTQLIPSFRWVGRARKLPNWNAVQISLEVFVARIESKKALICPWVSASVISTNVALSLFLILSIIELYPLIVSFVEWELVPPQEYRFAPEWKWCHLIKRLSWKKVDRVEKNSSLRHFGLTLYLGYERHLNSWFFACTSKPWSGWQVVWINCSQ